MQRRAFLAGTMAALPAAATTASVTLKEQLLGAWKISDAETVNVATGASKPWLGRPRPYTGMLVYLPNGLMSVQIGAARERARADAGLGNLSADEKIAYLDTYYGYYGRFEIDEAQSKVRHFVDCALFAFETGVTLVRTFGLKDGVLTLKTDNLAASADGATFNRLTWTRA
ncbi:MAG: lipocalin-like domain-containing protein [Vicinamibacterales bacterium]|nr:lipocalin-like domain-containing protein [Vicinamibacterales bacterium]